MSPLPVPLRVVAGLLALLPTAGLIRTAWPVRTQPGGGALTAVGVTLVAGVCTHLAIVPPVGPAVATVAGVEGRLLGFWVLAVFAFVGFTAVFWLMFALGITGRGQPLTRPVVAVLIAIPTALVVTGLLPAAFGVSATSPHGFLAQRIVGLLLSILVALLLLGTGLLVWPSVTRESVPLGQGVALGGSILPVSASPIVASVFVTPDYVFPMAVSVSAAGILAGLARYEPFEQLPVARPVTRRQVVNDLTDAVVVVDRTERLRDFNPAASEVFGLVPGDVGEISAQMLLERPVDEFSTADTVRADGRQLTVEAERLTDGQGRPVGSVVACRDTTDRRARERRLQLLTTVLTDVLCDELPNITAAERCRSVESASVRARIDALLAVVAHLRAIESRLDAERPGFGNSSSYDDRHTPAAVLRGAVSTMTKTSDPVVLDPPRTDTPVALDRRILQPALAAVLDTAAVYGEPVHVEPQERALFRITRSTDARLATPVESNTPQPAARLLRRVVERAGGSVRLSGDPWTEVVVDLPTVDGAGAT